MRRSESHYESLHIGGGDGALDAPMDNSAYVHMLPTPKSASAVSRRSKRATRTQQQRQSQLNQQNQRQHIGHVHIITWKERAQNFLDGPGGVALETFNVVLSIVLVVISIIESYESADVAVIPGYDVFELVCTGIFTIDFVLHLYAAEERWKFVCSPMGLIDIITIAPTYAVLFLQSLNVSFLPIVRIVRVFRMLSVLRLYRIVQGYRGFEYELGVLVFIIFTVIVVAAGIFQILDEDYYVENDMPKLEFHQAVYFVFVTISTVGYGDISPKTTASQLFVIAIICVVVTVIPRQIQGLVELSRLQHGYMHSYSVRKSGISSGGHVIVTGSISYESVSSFLSEFYRPRQGKVNMDVVILAEQIPTEKLLSVLRNVRYRRRTTFLKGSLLNDKDAKRVHVESAAAVFILADKKKVKHADAADALTILQALAVDKFKFRNQAAMVKRRNGGTIRCFLQVLSPQRTRGLRTITGVEVALNTPRLRTAILARSILCPGATALVLNLVCSLKEEHVEKALASNVPWIAEYSHGLQHQLYPVIMPQYFDGMKYERAAQKLHTHFNVILVAVYDKFASQTGEKRIRLCPFGHVLRENDLAFCIALSASDAQHAANSLFHIAAHEASLRHMAPTERANEKEVNQWGSPPTLVFSSDTVLDRQSMVRERAPSIELSDDESIATDLDVRTFPDQDEDSEEEDGGPVPAQEQQLPNLEVNQGQGLPPLLRAHTPPLLPPFLQHHHSMGGGITDWTLTPYALRKLHDHIIICGPFAHGHQLACYLDDLYHNELMNERRPTILLLVKKLPTEIDFQNLSSALPDNVFVEKGVSQNVEDLLHVRAYVARAVLMIPGNWKYHVDELRDETADEVNEHLLDYQVIMSTLSLRTVQDLHREHLRSHRASQHSMQPRELHRQQSSYQNIRLTPTISCSVVKWHESIAYFAHKSHTNHSHHFFSEADAADLTSSTVRSTGSWFHKNSSMDPHHRMAMMASSIAQQRMLAEFPKGPSPLFSPSYAAGEVFVDGVLDTLLCQSFFNPYVIDLVRAIAGDYYYTDHHSHSTPQNFMSSMMKYFQPPSSSHHTATAESDSHANKTSPTKPPQGEPAGEQTMLHPVLATAKVASELEGQSFASIYARALKQEILVLAIYRRPNDPRRGNALPYMFTCPKSSAEITVERGDTLHVLTKRVQPVCIQ